MMIYDELLSRGQCLVLEQVLLILLVRCVVTLFNESSLKPYLWGAIRSLVPGFPSKPFLLLVKWFGLQNHFLQLKRRVTV